MKKWYTEAITVQDEEFADNVVVMIAGSPGLLEDDHHFLEHFMSTSGDKPDAQTTRHSRSHDDGHNAHSSRPLTNKPDWGFFTAVNLFVAVGSYLITRCTATIDVLGSWISIMDVIVCLLLALYIVPMFAVTYCLWRRRIKWRRFTFVLEQYLTKQGELLLWLKKSLLFIQEIEVISRGFTMANHRSPVTRLEQGDGSATRRQCPQLRQMVFGLARETMLLHREGTMELVEKYPLLPEVDNVNNYIANISLQDYGECLTISLSDDNADQLLSDVTDKFSVAALKAMCRLCRLQCSEHIRRLAMMHIRDLQLTESNNIYVIDQCIYNGLRKLCHVIKIGANSMQRTYDFHRFSSAEAKSKPAENANVAHTDSAIYTAVHSLELHLLSSLKRSRDLCEHIEKQRQSGLAVGDYSELMSEFSLIRQELDACVCCWEEGTLLLDRMFGRNNLTNEAPKLVDVELRNPTAASVNIIGVEEPVIHDQVFEAYADPEDMNKGDYSWDEFLTPEEKAARKRQKSEAKRLLLELKSVIQVKAREHEEREKIAIQRMSGQIPEVALDEPCNHGNIDVIPDHTIRNSCSNNAMIGQSERCDDDYEESIFVNREKPTTCSALGGDDFHSRRDSFENIDYSSDHPGYKFIEDDEDEVGHDALRCHGNADRSMIERLKMAHVHGLESAFTTNVASLVAERSQALNLAHDTFGDDDSSGEEEGDRTGDEHIVNGDESDRSGDDDEAISRKQSMILNS